MNSKLSPGHILLAAQSVAELLEYTTEKKFLLAVTIGSMLATLVLLLTGFHLDLDTCDPFVPELQKKIYFCCEKLEASLCTT